MATYTKLAVNTTEEQGDILAAYLADYPFDSFDYAEGLFGAYAPKEALEEHHDEVVEMLESEGFIDYYFEDIEIENWNAKWESNFKEVEVDDKVLIRAPYHKSRQNYGGLDIIIQPKMSFGTGHHATTQLMVKSLLASNLKGKRVLDMGSGTGVLAIVAAKLGAESVLAVEIDDMAEESVRENIILNDVTNKIVSVCGDASAIEGERFDIVLANINRNILLTDMEAYAKTLTNGGELIISGFLAEDIEALTKHANRLGFDRSGKLSHKEWQALRFTKIE
ncbi:MAG: 50S ribosomal protein L11 methyltransferase [Alistipes sp.]|nr:50S ribosomal protein L11 methyltransferase [Alistipes sp.]